MLVGGRDTLYTQYMVHPHLVQFTMHRGASWVIYKRIDCVYPAIKIPNTTAAASNKEFPLVLQTPIIMKFLVAVTVLLVTVEFASSAPWKQEEAEVVLQDIQTLIALAEESNSLHESQAVNPAQSSPLDSLGAYVQQISTEIASGQPPSTSAPSGPPPSTPTASGQPPSTSAPSGQPPSTSAPSSPPPSTPIPSGRPGSNIICYPVSIHCHVCVERSGRFFLICRWT